MPFVDPYDSKPAAPSASPSGGFVDPYDKQATSNTPLMGMMGQPMCYPQQAQGMSFSPQAQPMSQAFGAMPTFVNPQLDESWTPPPPPSGPPVLEDDNTREHTAIARALTAND